MNILEEISEYISRVAIDNQALGFLLFLLIYMVIPAALITGLIAITGVFTDCQ